MSTPRVLYLTHRVPFPPDKGDRIRGYHLLRYLARRARVSLACLADEPVAPGTVAALEDLCERVALVRVGPRARWLRALASLAAGPTISGLEALDRATERDACVRCRSQSH